MGEVLLQKLKESVDTVQQKYGCHSGLAVEEDYMVSSLCRNLENIILHGTKFRKTTFFKVDGDDVLVWDLISRFLPKFEVLRFENEPSLKSGIGRLRSWLRSTLNDGQVEKYLQNIIECDNSLLKLYYEDDSLMLEKTIVSQLPQIMSGVSTVLFSFDLDRSSFNTPIRIDRTMSASIKVNTVDEDKTPSVRSGGGGKRRIKRPEIADGDNIDNSEGANANEPPSSADTLLLGSSEYFKNRDVDLKNLLTDLIPRSPTTSEDSCSSDEECQVEDVGSENIDNEIADSLSTLSVTPDKYHLKLPNQADDGLEASFEVGTLPDTPLLGEVRTYTSDSNTTQTTQTSETAPCEIYDEKKIVSSVGEENVVEVSGQEGDNDVTLPVNDVTLPVNDVTLPVNDVTLPVNDVTLPVNDVTLPVNDVTKLQEPVTITTVDAELEDPYEDLPRSSRVISRPYPLSVTKHLKQQEAVRGDVISCSVPTPIHPVLTQRSMSVQLPERPTPLGSPIRRQFDIDEFSNCDAISISSEISSIRDYPGCSRSIGDGMDHEIGSYSTDSILSCSATGELRNVLTSLLQQKDDMEQQNRQLQDTLSREVTTRFSLKEEVEQMQTTFIHRQSHDQTVIRALQRENQILKQQLKKYVTVVQQLRRDEKIESDHELASVLVEVPVIQPLQLPSAQSPGLGFSNSILEQKLAQVSEMHGELIELNQELMTKNLASEKQLQEMGRKLAEIDAKETKKREQSSSGKRKKAENTTNDISDFQFVEASLLQIWVPAAMVRGEGAKKHHVYQVIAQVPGEQWNVFRRYAEFRAFHKKLVQRHPYFSKLELPARTHFNRKVPSVVEDRRAKLEVYLQRVTSCLADRRQGVDIPVLDLTTAATKATVTSAIHFLRDEPSSETEDFLYRSVI